MLIELLIVCLVLAIAFYLLVKYVVPVIPAPWGNIVLAIIALIVVVVLLNRYLGLGLYRRKDEKGFQPNVTSIVDP